MTKPLDDDWILSVHEAAIEARLASKRDTLLALIDQKITSALPTRSDPSAQIFSDLGALNKYGPKDEPLDNAPIAIWLKSAIRLSEETAPEGCLVFQEALTHLSPPPPPPPPPAPDVVDDQGHIKEPLLRPPLPRKQPWPLILAIALALSIVGGIVYLQWDEIKEWLGGRVANVAVKPPKVPHIRGKHDEKTVEPYCQEPPAYIEGKIDLAFGFNQEDAEAKKTITAMKEMLAPSKKNGAAWSGVITRSPSLTGGISRTLRVTRWDVYFKDVDKSVGICEWLDKCKDFHSCKARITPMTPAPLHSIDAHKLLVPEKQP